MKKKLLQIIFGLSSALIFSQDGLNVLGSTISLGPGSTLRIENGDLRVQDGANIHNSSLISVGGDWYNNNPTSQLFTGTSDGNVDLTGMGGTSTVGGLNSTEFYNLTLSAADVLLQVPTFVGSNTAGSSLGSINLQDSRLYLNSNSLTISNSLSNAISRGNGYIISEDVLNEGKVIWQTIPGGGGYSIPFATASGEMIPLTVEPTSGDLGIISVSTYPTGVDMLPLPLQPDAVSSPDKTDGSQITSTSVNRFWQLDKSGAGGATVIFTYLHSELPAIDETTLQALRYNSLSSLWETSASFPADIVNNTVTVSSLTEFSPWTLSGTQTTPTPILAIDDITADNIVNAAEAAANINVTGTVSGDFNTGDTVTLTVDGTNYTGTVDALGAFSISVPGSALVADPDTTVDGSVTTTDAAGNTATVTDTQAYSVDTTAPAPVLTLDSVTADNILNASEASGPVVLTGTVSGDFNNGDTVTLTVDGTNYTGTVDALGAFSISVPGSALAADPDTTVDGSVTTTDAAGNPATVTDTQVYSVDTTAPVPVLTLDSVTTDNILNASEASGPVVLTGTVSGDFNTGDTVTLTVDGTNYSGTIDALGAFSISVPGSALAADPDTTVDGSVTTTDAAGNTATVTDTQAYSVDTTAPAPVLTLDSVTADNILNASEASGAVNLTGTVSGDFNSGDTVTLTVNGTIYTGTLDALGAFSISVPGSALAADPDTTVDGSVTTTDAAGNPATATDTQVYSVDTTTPVPVLTLDSVTADNILNANEASGPVTLTGTVSGDFNTGDTVTLTIDGTNYTGTIDALGAYSISVPGSALAADPDTTVDGSVTTTDAAGNPATVTDTQVYSVDTTAPVPVLAIDDITADNIVNAAEAAANINVTGTVSGDFNNGDTVTLAVDGTNYTGTVDALGAFSISIPGSALAADPDTTVDGSVTTTDAAGNPATVTDTQVYTVNTSSAQVPVVTNMTEDTNIPDDRVTADNTLIFSGTAEPNGLVEAFMDGVSLGTLTADSSGNWIYDNTANIIADGTYNINLVAYDSAGNPSVPSADFIFTVDTVDPVQVDIMAISDDTGLDGDMITSDNQLIIDGIAEPGSEVELFINGTSIGMTIADAGGNWFFDNSATTLPDGVYGITAISTDLAGNSSVISDVADVIIDTSVPVVNTFSTSDSQPVLTGTGEPGELLELLIDSNGDGTTDVVYSVTVDSSGNWNIDTASVVPDSGTFGPLSDGDSIQLNIADPAGNQSTGTVTRTSNTNSDRDSDGLSNNEEAVLGTDPDNPDTDNDGVNDGQELIDGTDPLDSCDSIGGQPMGNADCDGDSLINSDELALGTDIYNADTDGDGLEDGEEVAFSTNPLNSDTDGDSISDGQEVLDGTDPLNGCDSIGGIIPESSDCDQDGLSRRDEVELQTDPEDADTDGDGIMDGQEVQDSTNPLDPCDSMGGTPPAGTACDIEVESDLVSLSDPNGGFRIINIESFPVNTVTIFNRWGVKVFEAQGYDNQDNLFRGISAGRATLMKNKELPVGVYFYVIKYVKNNNGRTISGYLYVNR